MAVPTTLRPFFFCGEPDSPTPTELAAFLKPERMPSITPLFLGPEAPRPFRRFFFFRLPLAIEPTIERPPGHRKSRPVTGVDRARKLGYSFAFSGTEPVSATEAYELDTLGKHLLVEYHGCDAAVLNHVARIEAAMRGAAEAAGATVVTSTFHRFSPQGVSGVVVVEESHLSIHTWPERGYAAVDCYTCGDCEPLLAHEALAEALAAQRFEVLVVSRGLRVGTGSMHVQEHYRGQTEAELASTG